ncbi:MAG: MerR family transcriptional regulator [Casimicrobiaceae bacterium]
MSTRHDVNPGAPAYRSGVAARLAGVPVETLRVWERRYGVVGPNLSARGQRLYSAEQVARLTVVKQLVDMGHPIGAIATLSTETLVEMRAAGKTLSGAGAVSAGAPRGMVRIALVGPLLSEQRLEETLAGNALTVVGRCMNVAEAPGVLAGAHADVVLVELPSLNDGSLATIAELNQSCGASKAIVLYRFAPSAVIRRLRAAGHEVARAPSDAVEIESLCRALLQLPGREAVEANAVATTAAPPPPRFDRRSLAELAGASSTVYCECPRHLVDLVMSLGDFERYSAECASRTPDDAALHRDLQWTTAHARALLEDALVRVARAEGLHVPASPAPA